MKSLNLITHLDSCKYRSTSFIVNDVILLLPAMTFFRNFNKYNEFLITVDIEYDFMKNNKFSLKFISRQGDSRWSISLLLEGFFSLRKIRKDWYAFFHFDSTLKVLWKHPLFERLKRNSNWDIKTSRILVNVRFIAFSGLSLLNSRLVMVESFETRALNETKECNLIV